ncbi:MAG: ATP-dependent 6-phosphofructokinase [Anaerolineales bacterium]|nr:ATP-dependent 6-phosphofructokinase [Anaerolineales bacterium]
MDRIGILTGGGDAPGLNAVIRAVVKTAAGVYGIDVTGIRDGFEGLVRPDGVFQLTPDKVRGILPRGGTILGAANRGNPFAIRTVVDSEVQIVDASDQVQKHIEDLGLDALIVVGGDGTLRISLELFEKGCPIIGVPKTIDNDISGTEITFGFDTAVSMATEAIDRLHTTAEAHHRVMVLELMGRDAGFIALQAGVSGGADVILIPEIPFSYPSIARKIRERAEEGRTFSIIAAAEGAYPAGEQQVYQDGESASQQSRLGGIGAEVAEEISRLCGVEARVTVLGYLQRGGSPTCFDRWLATRYGAAAVRLANQHRFGRMVCLQGGVVGDISLAEALAEPKRVGLHGESILTARGLGICLGD